jgi:hypothetical protein
MRLAAVALLLLTLSGCAASGAQKAGAEPSPHALDRMCVDDCVGNGGDRKFCEDRCTY